MPGSAWFGIELANIKDKCDGVKQAGETLAGLQQPVDQMRGDLEALTKRIAEVHRDVEGAGERLERIEWRVSDFTSVLPASLCDPA